MADSPLNQSAAVAPGRRSEILSRLLEFCRPAAIRPLGFLTPDADVYDGPADTVAAMRSLLNDFTASEIEATGVAKLVDQEFIITAGLQGTFVALRDSQQSPYDLITSGGCLQHENYAVLQVLRDNFTQDLLPKVDNELYVANSIDDMILLRACGIPATLTAGLASIRLEDLEQFKKAFGWSTPQIDRFVDDAHRDLRGASQSEEISTSLVLVAWQPFVLAAEAPPELAAVINRLAKLKKMLDLHLSGLQMWEIESGHLEKLRFLRQESHAGFFAEAIFDISGATESIKFESEQSDAVAAPIDLAATIARLRNPSINVSANYQQETRRLVDVNIYQQLIQPLLEAVSATPDPLERSLRFIHAQLSHEIHTQFFPLGEQQRDNVNHATELKLAPNKHREALVLIDRLLTLTKQIQACRSPSLRILTIPHKPATSIQRLPHSDSPPMTSPHSPDKDS